MYKNKIFMKGRQRFVLYWKQTYSIGLARNRFHYLWRKIRKVLLIMSLLFRFHALRVAPKTIGHEVKAVCIKLIKHLTILKKHKRLFCRSRKHGIRLHILGVYAECGNIKTSFAKHKFLIQLHIKEDCSLYT